MVGRSGEVRQRQGELDDYEILNPETPLSSTEYPQGKLIALSDSWGRRL